MTPRAAGDRPPTLVIGVGSELRSDDAAGRRVVEHLATVVAEDTVEIRSVHQLTPELAHDACDRRLVVIVDAAVDVTTVTVRRVDADTTSTPLTHHLGAAELLRLADTLGTPPREVVTVAIPARQLEVGTELSPATARDVDTAVRHLTVLCRDVGRRPDLAE